MSTGDIIVISGLAIRVYMAYKDAPHDYRYISEEVAALRILIDKSAQLFKQTTISSDDRNHGQQVLKGCQGVLEDLNSLIEKYKRLASTSQKLVLWRSRPGGGDIAALQTRLISQTGLLNSFVRRFVVPVIPFYQFCGY